MFLLIYCIVVVSSVDNIIRPWVVGGRVELHPLVLLFFIFGGVEAFGFLGLFLGPVVASVLVALFDILREELNEAKTLPAASEYVKPYSPDSGENSSPSLRSPMSFSAAIAYC